MPKPTTPSVQRSSTRPIAVFGLVLLMISALASGALLLQHLGAMHLPGCGDGSGCLDLARSKWGKVPAIELSSAGLGFAYFLAMFVTWLVWGAVKRQVARGLVIFASMGGLVSVLFLIAMATEGKLCKYCLIAHGANFAFVASAWVCWAKSTRTGPHAGASLFQQLGAVIGLMLAIAAGVLGVESSAQATANKKHEAELAQSVKSMATPQTNKQPQPEQPAAQPIQPPTQPTSHTQPQAPIPSSTSAPLTGRFRWGPEQAAIRIVIFTDYQCPDCRLIEQQLEQVQKMGLSLNVSIRFYPFSTVCNERVTEDMHPDACFAASAALAVGTLGGTDAFWAMHQWLFDRKGAFTPQLLQQQAAALGLDGAAVVRIVNAKSNFDEVKSDIRLANDLGLRYTPMIFINGVELKGFTAPNALVRAVDALAKTNPAPAAAENDRPPLAAERYLADWREAQPVTLPERFYRRWLGDAKAPTTIVMVGDYMEPGTAEADTVIRMMVNAPGGGSGVRYNFVQFPMNQECNPQITFTKFPKSCLAARAAEGAMLAGGPDAFWRMHNWLMNNRDILSEELLRNGAPAIQLDAEALTVAMQQRWVADELNEDALGALGANVTSLPTIFINNKPAVSWKVGNENLLPRLIDEARRKK